ncbi:aldose epimerase family protein [Xinfangfangia sp. CPCC 101601]|uniref:Aldose 1-epimerase n=1 Tax=Pseudogemmobacter lacusdianii TaxID=3069608 RepID=A0ABU0VWI5_9RHOB|nr:aldose epimerase family protein [Xinfangfangia sp. CPCC 101601]MDQ2066121.1 aldose epimerase family protein [Xinfangfangia sp. CPCC 101601]
MAVQLWDATAKAHVIAIDDGGNCRARISDFGARLLDLWLPDAQGRLADVVLGHEKVAPYTKAAGLFTGATCGRFANRIAGAGFTLEGRRFELERNDGDNQLHGGSGGFHGKIWRINEVSPRAVRFALHAPEREMGYPGDLAASVRYAFTGPAQFEITMEAQVAGRATVVNMAHHSYFNLAGQGSGPIDAQLLRLDAPKYLPVDAQKIPIGAPAAVAGTAFDFRSLRALGALVPPGGFDHNFCLAARPPDSPQIEARDPASGRGFRLWTNQPGVQLYTGGHFPEGLPGKGGALYGPRAGFALETQGWPDSPNRPDFPSTMLRPGESYLHRMVFDLSPRAV